MIRKKLTKTQIQILKQLLLQIQDLQAKLNLLLQFLDVPPNTTNIEIDEKNNYLIIYTNNIQIDANNTIENTNNNEGRI